MTTTVVKTIGSTGDYSTVQAWEDATPADLTLTATSTCGVGSTTSAVVLNASASAVDSFYIGHGLLISGEERLITAYVGATKTATVGVLNGSASTFTGAPSSGTSYTVTDVIWQGQCQNQTFSTGSGAIVTIAGTTSDATRYVELTTVSGASFSDNASVQSNALRYNTSNGAALTTSGGYAVTISISVANTRISRLQVESTAGSSQPFSTTVSCIVDRCIFEGATSGVGVIGTSAASGISTFKNCLVTNRASGATKIASTGGNCAFYNCTFVVPSDKTAATNGLDGSYSTATVENCAVFGATNAIETGNSTFTITTSRTDQASPPSGFTQITYDTSTGSGFQNITDATRDFRIKSTSAMVDVGTTDSTNAAVDIAGTSRPSGSAYDIGAWEFLAASDTLMGQACL